MRYQFIGRKIPYTGKTLWEIVANLKNFGVGRLIKLSTTECFPEPSFLKILKVQALPPSKEPFEERFVKAWVEKIHRGVNSGKKVLRMTKFPRYKLIPKIEEEKYYKALEEMDKACARKYIYNYCTWPPLYKMMWEKSVKKDLSTECKSIPKLSSVTAKYSEYDLIKEDKTYSPITCSLYKYELSVEEMYKQIVQLKKAIKANS